jgi:hypothetical protein
MKKTVVFSLREGSAIKQWISRSRKHLNLEAERASKSLTDLTNGHHALVFHNSRYINEDIPLLANDGFICVTFYTSGDHAQTILSNFQTSSGNWHEISATNTEINIWGRENGKTKRVNIHHTTRNWTTLFVEHLAAYPQMHGRYIIVVCFLICSYIRLLPITLLIFHQLTQFFFLLKVRL